MGEWQRCPICNGTGLVGGGFYLSALGGAGVSNNSAETCRCCQGHGIILKPDYPPTNASIPSIPANHT